MARQAPAVEIWKHRFARSSNRKHTFAIVKLLLVRQAEEIQHRRLLIRQGSAETQAILPIFAKLWFQLCTPMGEVTTLAARIGVQGGKVMGFVAWWWSCVVVGGDDCDRPLPDETVTGLDEKRAWCPVLDGRR